MALARVRPGPLGFDLCTFDCMECDRTERVNGANSIRAMAFKFVASADLRPPPRIQESDLCSTHKTRVRVAWPVIHQ
jgi:hypothetical protein